MREISYALAINETLHQLMDSDERIALIGQGVTSPWYVGSTTEGLLDRFGSERVVDTPVSEGAITGVAAGMALAGMRPVLVHPRMDFMYYAMDQIANQIANWHYMFGGQVTIPLTMWAIVNRGGEQAAQHSQSLQAIFTHLPGIKVVMPSSPSDAKGLLISSVRDENPVIFIDDRWLYTHTEEVLEEMYSVPLGKGEIKRRGKHLTLVATSYLVAESVKAAVELERSGLDVELIDPRSIKPLDEDIILGSVKNTGRLLIADGGWKTCGFGAEIAALVAEKAFQYLKGPIIRVSLPDAPAPASRTLEEAYYPSAETIVSAVKESVTDI